jgi:omega-amidase
VRERDEAATVSALVGQLPVSFSVADNLERIIALVRESRPGDLILTPEGSLSGYLVRTEDLPRLAEIDREEVRSGLETLQREASDAGVHLWVGACLAEVAGGREHWANAAIGLTPEGGRHIYRKANLATVERGTFVAGNELPVFDLRMPVFDTEHPAGSVRVGVQICREVRFPEQWLRLARGGAEIVLHLNNGVAHPAVLAVWRSHLVSRSAELQRFVVSANAAAPSQHSPSMVVAPGGEVLAELPPGVTASARVELDLSRVSDRYLDQRRTDL